MGIGNLANLMVFGDVLRELREADERVQKIFDDVRKPRRKLVSEFLCGLHEAGVFPHEFRFLMVTPEEVKEAGLENVLGEAI